MFACYWRVVNRRRTNREQLTKTTHQLDYHRVWAASESTPQQLYQAPPASVTSNTNDTSTWLSQSLSSIWKYASAIVPSSTCLCHNNKNDTSTWFDYHRVWAASESTSQQLYQAPPVSVTSNTNTTITVGYYCNYCASQWQTVGIFKLNHIYNTIQWGYLVPPIHETGLGGITIVIECV